MSETRPQDAVIVAFANILVQQAVGDWPKDRPIVPLCACLEDAGPARLLVSAHGCHVDCVEISPDYCAGAVLMNRLTGLDERIKVYRCSALDLPFPDDSFDVFWMQNVGMNIADKQKLYREIYRVLQPGGLFAFPEMAARETLTSYFPLPRVHRSRRQLPYFC